MPGYNSQRRGTARTPQISYFFYCYVCLIFLIVMYVPFSVFCVLFVCKCVLYYRHRVSTQLQLNIYHQTAFDAHYSVVWSHIANCLFCWLVAFTKLSPCRLHTYRLQLRELQSAIQQTAGCKTANWCISKLWAGLHLAWECFYLTLKIQLWVCIINFTRLDINK
jgi:hypothetical protein